MSEIEISIKEAREPSIQFIRDMIDDTDKKFNEWLDEDWDSHSKEDKYYWMKQQLIDIVMVHNACKERGL